MLVSSKGRLLFCALALICMAHGTNSLPTRSKKGDVKSVAAVLKPEAEDLKLEESRQHPEAPIEEITNELEKLLVSMKKRHAIEKEAARESQGGPKNVVLILSRDPLALAHNNTEVKRSLFSLFPVKHMVKDRTKRSLDEPMLLVSPVLLPRRGPYGSTHSCQAALDNSVSALLSEAMTKRQMVTGFLASDEDDDPTPGFWQQRSIVDVSNADSVSDSVDEGGKRALGKRSAADKDEDVDKKMDDASESIAPINDKFQKIGIEDKGTGILYKKVEIVGGAKKTDGAEPPKDKITKVVKREVKSAAKNGAESAKEGADAVKDKGEIIKAMKREAEPGKEEAESVKDDVEAVNLKGTTNNKVEKKKEIDRATENGSWDFFDAINRMRRSFLDRFLRGLGFDFSQNQGNRDWSPLLGLVDNTLSSLEKESDDHGFMLVVSGGDAGETAEVVKLVRRRTNPVETLVVVTGMCPGPEGKDKNTNFWQFDPSNQMTFSSQDQRVVPTRQRDANRIPLYASGPGSELLNEVDNLWDVPEAIKNMTVDAPAVKTDSAKEKEQYYGYKTEEKKLPLTSPYEFYAINNEAAKDKPQLQQPVAKQQQQQQQEKEHSDSGFPTKHREQRSADWRRLSALNVREKMADNNAYARDSHPEPAPSWFEDDYNNDLRHDEMLALRHKKEAEEEGGLMEAEEARVHSRVEESKEGIKEEERKKKEGEKRNMSRAAGGARSCFLVTCVMMATIKLF